MKRPAHLEPIILSVAMLKGGVGKTSTSTNLAAACAHEGLRTLFVDLDPQASGTMSFGYVPIIDGINPSSISSSLCDDFDDIYKIIRPTHYGNLDIITSSLELQGADLILPNPSINNVETMGPPMQRLQRVLGLIKHNYDVIICDCAPAHSSVTLNALAASNALIMTVTPHMLSYGSSLLFTKELQNFMEGILDFSDENDISPDQFGIHNDIFRLLITNDPQDAESRDVSAFLRSLYGKYVLNNSMISTIALSRSQNDMGLLYDVKRSSVRKSKSSFDRGMASMEMVNREIISLFKDHWGAN